MATKKHGGGAPQKAPGGLESVLYVRAPEVLVEALDKRMHQDRKKTGYPVSRSDVTRALLFRALKLKDPASKTTARRQARAAR